MGRKLDQGHFLAEQAGCAQGSPGRHVRAARLNNAGRWIGVPRESASGGLSVCGRRQMTHCGARFMEAACLWCPIAVSRNAHRRPGSIRASDGTHQPTSNGTEGMVTRTREAQHFTSNVADCLGCARSLYTGLPADLWLEHGPRRYGTLRAGHDTHYGQFGKSRCQPARSMW